MNQGTRRPKVTTGGGKGELRPALAAGRPKKMQSSPDGKKIGGNHQFPRDTSGGVVGVGQETGIKRNYFGVWCGFTALYVRDVKKHWGGKKEKKKDFLGVNKSNAPWSMDEQVKHDL